MGIKFKNKISLTKKLFKILIIYNKLKISKYSL